MRGRGFFLTICLWAGWFIFFPPYACAHTGHIPLIVDSDMALDDVRALILLFNSDTADIRLIVCADGALTPAQGCHNLRLLLKKFNREDIRLAAGTNLKKTQPFWKKYSLELFPSGAGKETITGDIKSFTSAVNALRQVLNSYPESVVYLCLGPMTNLAEILRSIPQAKSKISRIIYYGSSPDNPNPDWNTARDIVAARAVFASGLPIYAMASTGTKTPIFDIAFLGKIERLDTPASRILVEIHRRPILQEPFSRTHFRVWDEMTVIYLFQPDGFAFQALKKNIFVLNSFDAAALPGQYLRLLNFPASAALPASEPITLAEFPVKPGIYASDLRPLVKQIIDKYGLEEWRACVLTNELHRHLGAYNIIGAKMGIRAREILAAPMDSLRVTSMAGNKSPQSCLNDGLQAATGSTLGRGNIEISPQADEPAAIFYYRNKAVRLRLKSHVVEKIKASIRQAIADCGDLTPAYFARIREISIRFWLDFDRREIFQETFL